MTAASIINRNMESTVRTLLDTWLPLTHRLGIRIDSGSVYTYNHRSDPCRRTL